jgi:polyisoprenoid-binding protein YceI
MAAPTTNALRTADGRQVPVPGEWVIDPSHSDLQLIARHVMISKVRGRFREFSGRAFSGVKVEADVEAIPQSGTDAAGR